MYQYDVIDKEFTADRVSEFREQVDRRLAGEISTTSALSWIFPFIGGRKPDIIAWKPPRRG